MILSGHHLNASVSAIAWHPANEPRDPKCSSSLRLASGDDTGRVVVWDVGACSPLATLDDPLSAAEGRRKSDNQSAMKSSINGLAWVTASPSVLAVLVSPGYILLWECRSGGILWKKDLQGGSGEVFAGLRVDPLDRRGVCIAGNRGTFIALCIENPSSGRVVHRQYKADLAPGGSLACAFSGVRDILFVVLDREIIVFDLELGRPVVSTPLAASIRPNFKDILGSYGYTSGESEGETRGIDMVLCSHTDGSVSIWRRREQSLSYVMSKGMLKLLPPSPKFLFTPAPLLLALLTASAISSGDVCMVGAASDGRVYHWRLPLYLGTVPPMMKKGSDDSEAAPKVDLVGMCTTLPGKATSIALCPQPISLQDGTTIPVAAVATTSGCVAIIAAKKGTLNVLSTHIVAMIALLHGLTIKGVEWLGSGPRLLCYASDDTAAHGYHINKVYMMDASTREYKEIRSVQSEAGPLVGIRTSKCGSYALLILRRSPSEIWDTRPGHVPTRIRQIDLPFTAVEWVDGTDRVPEKDITPVVWCSINQQQGHTAREYAAGATPYEDLPERRLSFALVDGRVGVLAVKGRRITDTQPHKPTWMPIVSGDFRATALSAWAHLLLLGDADGLLVCWDVKSGQTQVLETGGGRIIGLKIARPPADLYKASDTILARIGVLFGGSGPSFNNVATRKAFAVYDLTVAGTVRSSHVDHSSAFGRVGPVIDFGWVPIAGGGSILGLVHENGSLLFVDTTQGFEVRPKKRRELRWHATLLSDPMLYSAVSGVELPSSPTLLPRPWILFLRLLLQQGMTVKMLSSPNEQDVWSLLPSKCHAAWDQMILIGHGSGTLTLSGGDQTLQQLLNQSTIVQDSPKHDYEAAERTVPPPSARRSLEVAEALGYRNSKRSEVAQTFKSLGGAFKGMAKEVALVGKKTLASGSTSTGSTAPSPERNMVGGGSRSSSAWDASDAPLQVLLHDTETLLGVLRACADQRGHAHAFLDSELDMYASAQGIAARMAVAAEIFGSLDETRFWRRLPATLKQVKVSTGHPFKEEEGNVRKPPTLWSESATLSEALERSAWHQSMGRAEFEKSEELQEQRMLELVSLGDFAAAVELLLSSPPACDSRYYRDALCTLGLACACHGASEVEAPMAHAGARSLFVQAAKMITANAAGVGDILLGVPLLCAIDHKSDAVALFQDAGMWYRAASLTAGSLSGSERSAALKRWASHLAYSEGRPWMAAGVLIVAGALSSAVSLLSAQGLPDASMALILACSEAGFERQELMVEDDIEGNFETYIYTLLQQV